MRSLGLGLGGEHVVMLLKRAIRVSSARHNQLVKDGLELLMVGVLGAWGVEDISKETMDVMVLNSCWAVVRLEVAMTCLLQQVIVLSTIRRSG
jgi:hypothetical protein